MKQLIEYTGDVSIIDSCCGEGLILRQLAEHPEFHVATYGVELDKGRAALAETTLDYVVQAPIESMVISNDAFGFCFLNPPYDHTMRNEDDETDRKEFLELERAYRYLMPGGLMMYVIPHYRFADKKIARFLATHFSEISIARFTDENFGEYKQCVFIGRKKRGTFKEFNEKLYAAFKSLENEEKVLNILPNLAQLVEKGKRWTIPNGRTEIPTFYTRLENKEVFIDSIRESKGFNAFIERTKPKTLELTKQPLMPLAQGQIALLLASGAINGLIASPDNPEGVHVVQGMEVVSKVVTTEETEDSITTKIRTKRDISVKIITPEGVVKKLM
ncbi:DUF6094 domain-containing protein [Ureibacillus chungkukjangi]|nr:DUF6094 domain-containing protein [Ureibacillus chungkukjangi]